MLTRFIARIRAIAHRRSVASELDEELQFHLEHEIGANIARGLPPEEARRIALRDLGGLSQTREAVREVRATGIESIWRDLSHAFRTLRAAPGFAAAAVATLALAIGANSAIFSVVSGILLRPLPYEQSDRLVLIVREQTLVGAHQPVPAGFFAKEDADGWQHALRTFDMTALYSSENAALQTASGSEVIDSAVVSASFFPTMRGVTVAGRPLGEIDDMSTVVVISERLAERLFGRPQGAIGQGLMLSRRPYTVVGVAARQFQVPSRTTDVWMPAGFAQAANSRCCSFKMIGRLKSGETLAGAAAEAKALAVTLRTLNPGAPPSMRATAVSLRDQIVNPVRPALLVLFAAAGLVLLAACANVAQLLFARNAARSRERAIRAALGASRMRLVRQSLIESLLLATAGTAVGLALARLIVGLVTRSARAGIPRLDSVHLDTPVLLFSIGLTAVATLGTGLAPALQSTNAADSLKSGSATTTSAGGRRRLHGALCVVQLGVSLVLMVGAVLLGRSLVRLVHTDVGVRTDHVVTASLNVAFGGRPTDLQTRDRVARIVDRLHTLPGVQAVGVGTGLPPNLSRLRLTLKRQGDTVDYQASANAATPGYFDALGLRLLKGRFFTAEDDADHPPVFIMSVDMAKRFFGDGNPIGRTMSVPGLRNGAKTSEEMTLVGVVSNVKYSGLDTDADDSVYRPFAQQTWVAPFLVLRTTSDAERLASTIQREISSVDRDIVVSDARTMDAILADATASPRFRTVLLGAIAGLAVVIASIGLYSVTTQAVSQRTREIGIRMALGGQPHTIQRMVLREGIRLGVVGIGCGLAGAFALTRVLTGLLYGITPTDGMSYGLACLGILILTVLASYLPARRATKVDPILVLRAE